MILPAWISRLAAVALLLAVLGSAYVFTVPPLLGRYADNREAIAQSRQMLIQYQQIGRSREGLQAQITELNGRKSARGAYLTGGTDALAAAELQDRVKNVIESNGGKLRSIQTVPGKADEGFKRVTIRVQLSGTTSALYKVLYRLESSTPFLFLDNLDIGNRRARRRRQKNANPNPELRVRFDLYGYLREDVG